MRKLASVTIMLWGLILSLTVLADGDSYKQVGDTQIHYSAFNSSFLSADIASIYNLSRGSDKGFVNIAVVPEGVGHGTTAVVSGTVNNLIAQQQILDFIEIREGEAVYYLAPFTFDNEDPLNFTVNVRPADGSQTHKLNFKRTFYHDD